MNRPLVDARRKSWRGFCRSARAGRVPKPTIATMTDTTAAIATTMTPARHRRANAKLYALTIEPPYRVGAAGCWKMLGSLVPRFVPPYDIEGGLFILPAAHRTAQQSSAWREGRLTGNGAAKHWKHRICSIVRQEVGIRMSHRKLVRTLIVGALAVGAGTTAVAVPLAASAASTRYEAESATLSAATVANNHPGFTGTGFVDYTNAAGGFVEFSVNGAQAGSVTLTFRYANGTTTARPVDVAVNGQPVQSVSFGATGDWATWKTLDVTATLTAGTNTVRATGTGSAGRPNLGTLTLTHRPPSPPPTPAWSAATAKPPMDQHNPAR